MDSKRKTGTQSLIVLLAILPLAFSLTNKGDAQRMPIVAEGKSLARVVTHEQPSPIVDGAASLLVEYIRRSTGVTLEKVNDAAAPVQGMASIHCGSTKLVQGLKLKTEKMDKDGFVIAFPSASSIVLTGPTDLSVEYAVYDFLERYVGVRWLFPGAVGEHVPTLKSLSVPAVEVRQEPAFRHRLFSGLGKEEKPESRGEQGLWAKRNRMHDRLQFHHNLWSLYLPEKYTATHPEFFPMIGGKRFLPVPAEGKTSAQDVHAQVSWQPCFTAPGGIEEAVKNICEHFEKNPSVDSYSFGINDSNDYCTCDTCTAKDGGGKNVLGVRNISQSYYSWCNAVATGVNARFPDKVFGLLAYNGSYSPPQGFKLNPHVVPMMTYDRMKWADTSHEATGHALTELWGKSASVVGWYDYIYGGQFYLAPRVYFHQMEEYLRYGYDHNVRYY